MQDFTVGDKNKYMSVYYGLREEIARGKYKAGEKLPSKRALAEELGVSVVTVQLAYEQLLAEGYVLSKQRSGYYAERVSAAEQPARERERASETKREEFKIDFVKSSAPAETFPFSVWTKLIRAVLADCGEHLLERVPCGGDLELRTAIADYLYRARGIDVDPEYVIIGGGAEHLYGVIVQLLGRDKVFALENPGYIKVASTYALNGATIMPICAIYPAICRNESLLSGCDVLHISPSHQFPTGAVLSASIRSALIEWATSCGRYIIEDDYDSEFRMTGKPLQCMYSLCPDRVIYMNTFSKSLAPSMRMGYMVLPPTLYERYKKLFSQSASIVPLFEQKTLASMISGGYFERHLTRLKNYYKGIRQKLLCKFNLIKDECTVHDTGSGLHFIAEFPSVASDSVLKDNAKRAGVRVRCLSDYLLAPLDGVEKRAVINYSGLTESAVDGFDANCFIK